MGEIWQKNAMKLGQNSKTYELISSIDIGTFRMMLPFIWDGQGQSMIKWAKQAYQ